mmetsp:Transcript_18657/g.51023  ORF Transcript_18657/g.51023 Transcript_18657/m.51023 type:complete len:312 (+) Transcript_18657:180-1115(+)
MLRRMRLRTFRETTTTTMMLMPLEVSGGSETMTTTLLAKRRKTISTGTMVEVEITIRRQKIARRKRNPTSKSMMMTLLRIKMKRNKAITSLHNNNRMNRSMMITTKTIARITMTTMVNRLARAIPSRMISLEAALRGFRATRIGATATPLVEVRVRTTTTMPTKHKTRTLPTGVNHPRIIPIKTKSATATRTMRTKIQRNMDTTTMMRKMIMMIQGMTMKRTPKNMDTTRMAPVHPRSLRKVRSKTIRRNKKMTPLDFPRMVLRLGLRMDLVVAIRLVRNPRFRRPMALPMTTVRNLDFPILTTTTTKRNR